MPELPEVETIKRQLNDKVVGLTINNILINKPKLFIGSAKDVIGAKITNISRRAKMLIIDLQPQVHLRGVHGHEKHLLIHLKMSGQLIYSSKDGKYAGLSVPNKFTHITFELSDGSKLFFNDMRQFGWIKLLTSKELKNVLEKIGPEPLSTDFTLEKFRDNLFVHKKLKIKPTLMDQSMVAGIGNIYASESCFLACIDPRRRIETLSHEEIKRLFQSIKKILSLAVKYQGTSADAYVTLDGKKGDYYSRRLVYDREGEKCPNNCGGIVEKIKLAGRGTYFCPGCQH